MRSKKTTLATFLFLFFISVSIWAQKDRYQLYVVHEDHVNNGMMDKHHTADKKIVEAAKTNKMKGMDWITFVGDDSRVMYLSPIKNMAELDNNPFEDLKKKMGEKEFEDLFDSYDGTYSQHGDYILRLDKELSYMPDGMTQTPEGQNYREITFYHIPPGSGEKAEELAKSVKKMYEDKNSKIHYRLYKNGFGTMGAYFMVAVAAESPEQLENRRKENMELLGEEGKSMRDKIDNTFSKQEKVTGYIMPELSYVYK
ncbi:hypothetical protein G3I01_15710 [Gramella sp. MT6]|uniref:hypothetical protein n=1 Tax=Gramella sp. MT6 TaxID=2705471 RepID=UPI001C5ECFFA|nr:hypothetical protein [Gramella sp. MT6]QYA26881.1 hypothetical protein G3I01_15710 [Gramella sp. MT6]